MSEALFRARISYKLLFCTLILIAVTNVVAKPVGGQGGGSGKCRWMTKREFQNISLDSSEVIIRDDYEQPCYIIACRAFVRLNDSLYFPLRQFKVFQHAYRVIPVTTDEGAGERLLLNCSVPNGGPGQASNQVTLLPAGGTMRAFREEIIIMIECGYLVIQTRVDNSQFSLESISFYHDSKLAPVSPVAPAGVNDGSIKVNDANAGGQSASSPANWASRTVSGTKKRPAQSMSPRQRAMSLMKPEHLVFSSEGANHQAPLLKMPLVSRYICQNRIELTGRNSIQLVLERFELQRLTHQPTQAAPVSRSPQSQQARTQPQGAGQVSKIQSPAQVAQAQTQHPDHPMNTQEAPTAIQSQQANADPKLELQNNHLARYKRLNEMATNTSLAGAAPWLIKTSSSSSNNQPDHRQTSRHTRDTTILYKSPLVSVTTCPSPATPSSPLYSMMDSSIMRSYDTLDLSLANKWTTSANSATTSATKVMRIDLGFRASNNCWLLYGLTLYLVNYIMRRCFPHT